LDEVPNSSWFTNRIGLYPLTPEEAARGPCRTGGPSMEAPWTVVRAKTEGVTPGFNIRDARGDVYVVKFDPPGFLGMTTAAGVISNRILHAAGYFVPEDGTVVFRRSDLAVGENVMITLPDGTRRAMTEGDIDGILSRVTPLSAGVYLAACSRFLEGKPAGPFDYDGRRKDDENDRIRHQDRRELRGLRVFAAWLNHFDTKQHNTLDMYVEEEGRTFLRHYLIDFASTVGAGARGPDPFHGYEFGLDFAACGTRLLTLGMHEDEWRMLERPFGLEEIGYFDGYRFAPERFKPLTPNTSFARMTDRDGYWAAKIISAFSDAHLEAIVETAHYRDPEAAKYMARVLGERRDRIARTFFDRVPPLDFFRLEGETLRFRDLGVERGIYEEEGARYRYRVSAVDENRRRGGRTRWAAAGGKGADLSASALAALAEAAPDRYPFLAVELQVDRRNGWSDSVTAFLSRRSGRVIAVRR